MDVGDDFIRETKRKANGTTLTKTTVVSKVTVVTMVPYSL
jgi:hypothetical protein